MDEPRDLDNSPDPELVPPPDGSANVPGGPAPTEKMTSVDPEAADGTEMDATEVAPTTGEPGAADTEANEAEADAAEGDTGETKSGGAWKWVILAILVVILIGVIILIFRSCGESAAVPDVEGLTLQEATTSLEAAGFELGEVEYLAEVEADVLPGTVVAQTPEAGDEADVGSTVDLSVAQPTEISVPSVVGAQVDEATETLEKWGLTVTTQEVDAIGTSAGVVVEQDPAAGTAVAVGSEVMLSVATGRTEAEVPDVVGSTQQAATAALESEGFVVSVGEAYDDDVDQGVVISQRPSAGVTAAIGETVTITVSRGPSPNVTVPDVVGQTEADAVSQLDNLGLEAVPSGAYSSSVPAGSVISQNPVGGTVVETGSMVAIVISLGAEPPSTVTMPDVLGMAESEATSALEAAGYDVMSAEVYTDKVETGIVGWQVPIAGSVTEPGISVAIVVSAGPRPPEFVTVPDVRDMTLEDATDELESIGLEVVYYEVSSSVTPAGEVIAQLPPPGYSVGPGSTVILVVSSGELEVTPQ